MAKKVGSSLILTQDEMRRFLAMLNDPETIKRRDEFFKELDQIPMKENEDGSFEFEMEVDE